MIGKKLFAAVLGIMLVLTLGLTSCATNVASGKVPKWDQKPLSIAGERDYTILGTVKLEKRWYGIMGISIRSAGIDAYIYQSGGLTYADLLTEAKRLYPEANGVIDISLDFSGSTYAIFYAQRTNIVTGLAVKYVAEPAPPSNNPNVKGQVILNF